MCQTCPLERAARCMTSHRLRLTDSKICSSLGILSVLSAAERHTARIAPSSIAVAAPYKSQLNRLIQHAIMARALYLG